MRHLGALLLFLAIATAGASAHAESPTFETGPDVGMDTSFPEVDADDVLDVPDVPGAADTDADDTAVADDAADASDDTAVVDTAVPDTAPADSGVIVDSAALDTATSAPDTGRPPGPGTVTENPGDPYTVDGGDGGCQWRSPRSGSSAGASALLIVLFVFTRRKYTSHESRR